MASPPVPSKVFCPSLPIRQLSRNMRAALRNGSCRACHAVGARNIARLRAQSRPAYCAAPKPSFEKAPAGKAPPKITGCRSNGEDITRTHAPQNQGSISLPAGTRDETCETPDARTIGETAQAPGEEKES